MAASSFPKAPASYGCFTPSVHSRLAQPSSSWRASAHDFARLPSHINLFSAAFASSLLHSTCSPRTAPIRSSISHGQVREEQELAEAVEIEGEAKLQGAEGLEQELAEAVEVKEEAAQGLVQAPGSSLAGPTVEEAKASIGLYAGRRFVDLKRGKGLVIADVLMVFGGLLDRPFGSGRSIAGAGEVVIERVLKETEILRGKDDVDERLIFELLRVLRLLEMDLELLRAARKDETLLERLEGAKVHCRQAVLIANAM